MIAYIRSNLNFIVNVYSDSYLNYIDKKVVSQTLKSPAIEMIAGLNFNIQMIYLSKKGRVKGRVFIDL